MDIYCCVDCEGLKTKNPMSWCTIPESTWYKVVIRWDHPICEQFKNKHRK